MLKLLLKIYPAFLPILLYVFWVFVVQKFISKIWLKSKKTIEGEKVVGNKTTSEKVEKEEIITPKISNFSLQNRHFIAVLYLSFLLAILTLIFAAFRE
jgi:hypothetical protein